jgi:hypothetical protein
MSEALEGIAASNQYFRSVFAEHGADIMESSRSFYTNLLSKLKGLVRTAFNAYCESVKKNDEFDENFARNAIQG